MILADTSVWVDHLRRGNQSLVAFLEDGSVLGHPLVFGELACGNLKARGQILELLAALPPVIVATHEEALRLLDAARLFDRGLGWIDIHLLTSARLTGCRLWTLDKALAAAAAELGVALERRFR
jgi:predicted nucleic acid-binding protein